jgi:hypothetical protein
MNEENEIKSINRLLARELSPGEIGDVAGAGDDGCSWDFQYSGAVDTGGTPDAIIDPVCVDIYA